MYIYGADSQIDLAISLPHACTWHILYPLYYVCLFRVHGANSQIDFATSLPCAACIWSCYLCAACVCFVLNVKYKVLRNELEPDPRRDKYHTWFPSSIDRAEGPEPPPMYTYHTRRRDGWWKIHHLYRWRSIADTYYIPYTMCVCFVFTEQTVRLIFPYLCHVPACDMQHIYNHIVYVLHVSASYYMSYNNLILCILMSNIIVFTGRFYGFPVPTNTGNIIKYKGWEI